MDFFVLGTSGMMPLPNRFLTSAMIRYEGSQILIDCGEGTQVALRKQNLRWKNINLILITHTHADHITGLPGLLMLSSQVQRTEPLVIIGPPKIREYIEMNRKVLDMYINYEIIIQELDMNSLGIVYENEKFSIRAIRLDHGKPCVGYIWEEKDKPGVFYPEKANALNIPKGPLWASLQKGNNVHNSEGRLIYSEEVVGTPRPGIKISYVTDTMYLDSISSEVGNSDLFVCEGMFESALEDDAREKKHLTVTQAAKIAKEAGGVKCLGLTHFSPRYTDYDLKKNLKQAKEVFEPTILLKEKMHFDFSKKEDDTAR